MRVLLADDHALFRAGIASLLSAWGIEVVGQAADGLEALEQARTLRPDLVLMDITMPNCNGLEATRLIKAELPEIRIVMVTVSDHDEDLFEAIKSGAEGYLLKDMSEDELSRTLEGIAAGEAPFSRSLALKILDEFARLARDERPQNDADALTPREREVLELVADGSTNREVAAALFLSPKTVEANLGRIYRKLGITTRAELGAWLARTPGEQRSPDPDAPV